MLDCTARIDHLAHLAAEEVARHTSMLPSAQRLVRIVAALDGTAPHLSGRFVRLAQRHPMVDALARVLADYIAQEIVRVGDDIEWALGPVDSGLGAAPRKAVTQTQPKTKRKAAAKTKPKASIVTTPPGVIASEHDDVAVHNNPSPETKQR